MKHIRHVILASCLLWSAVAAAQNPLPNGFQSLSGRWEGNQVLYQRGDCKMDTGVVAPSDMRWTLTVRDDGTLTADVFINDSKQSGRTWTGKIDSDLGVTVAATTTARCNGKAHDYTVNFTGKIVAKKGKYELVIQAEDAPCPTMKCIFRNRIQLRKLGNTPSGPYSSQ